MQRDPLANPAPLIQRIYSYVAYRIGDGPDAEDVTSEVFERALRYRASYDESRGSPMQWLFGIARRCVDDLRSDRIRSSLPGATDEAPSEDLGSDVVQRLTLSTAIDRLDNRSRDLLALRYGADLTARQIGSILGLKTNAVEVALHRTLSRLRTDLEEPAGDSRDTSYRPAAGTSPP